MFVRVAHIFAAISFYLVLAATLDFASVASNDPYNDLLKIEWNVAVTDAEGSHLNWYEIKADPEDTHNLIVCGAGRKAQDNAYYGVVYSSRDGGKTWKKVLEDRNSTWVSEQSCTFGDQHMAYFVSEASNVVDGQPHHSSGTTRIFESNDAGLTWAESARTGWADYPSSVVAKPPGSNAKQYYVFYNANSKYDASRKLGSTLDFFTMSKDKKHVSEHQTVPAMAERNYQGVYPTSSVVMNDGSPVVLFDARRYAAAANKIDSFEIGVVRFDSRGQTAASIIATHSAMNDPPVCPFSISNTLGYDKTHGVLYVAYNDFISGDCRIMLTSSHDGGRTWSQPHELLFGNGSRSHIYFPVLSVNRNGIIGLLWRGKPERSPDCWFFSVSRDGLNLNDTISLAPCANIISLEKQSSAYLTTVIPPAKPGEPVSVNVLTFRDYLTRVGITATPDGVFHPIWSTLGDGFGELRTANIRIVNRLEVGDAEPATKPVLTDVTDKIRVLYGGIQRLDHSTRTVMLAVSLRNDGHAPIAVPLYLKIESASSDYGMVRFENPAPSHSLDVDYLDISSLLSDSSLAPGATTPAIPLNFHLMDETPVLSQGYFVVKFNLRVLSLERPARVVRPELR